MLISRLPHRGTALRVVLALTLAVSLLLPATAHAGPKTDVILLRNGDRVTCEILELALGLLQVSTDSMGTLKIEWMDVKGVSSPRLFEAETSLGLRYYGSIAPGATGQLTVVEFTGPVVIALYDIVRLVPLKKTLASRLDGNIAAGGSYTQSSGVGQASVNVSIGARRRKFEWRTSFDGTVTLQKSEPDTGRVNTQAAYTRLLRNRWMIPASLTVERNPDLGFSVRSTVALGVGRSLIQTNRSLLRLGGGLAANEEVPVDGETTENIELRFPFDYQFFTYNFPKTNLAAQAVAFPSLSDPGRFRFNSNFTISRDLFISDFYLAVTLYNDFDNRPPGTESSKNDVGVTLSMGWKF